MNDTPEIPDFDLLRLIGEGGFGRVWLARNRTTSRIFAVKVIPLRRGGENHAATREISSITRLEANARCRHENLLGIHHVGKTAEHLFYVMTPADDVSGEPASDKADYRPATLQLKLEGGQISPETCLDYARQLLAGLSALHAAGMVHRDVKPANCLFVGGRLKLADFGLLTESHPLVSRVGTRKYMPPDGRMDRSADVYAAGLVIYEMLSGRPVESFPSLGRRARELGDNRILSDLSRVMLRACEREPESRFSSATKMLAELNSPMRSSGRRSRRWILAACAAGLLLAALAAGEWMRRGRDVEVSFVTTPYEARIFLDGELLVDSTGAAYATPCTVGGLAGGAREVAFECEGTPRWIAGRYDFSKTRQIVSERKEQGETTNVQ